MNQLPMTDEKILSLPTTSKRIFCLYLGICVHLAQRSTILTFGVDDIRSFNSSCSEELFSGQDALMGTRICGSNYLNFRNIC